MLSAVIAVSNRIFMLAFSTVFSSWGLGHVNTTLETDIAKSSLMGPLYYSFNYGLVLIVARYTSWAGLLIICFRKLDSQIVYYKYVLL